MNTYVHRQHLYTGQHSAIAFTHARSYRVIGRAHHLTRCANDGANVVAGAEWTKILPVPLLIFGAKFFFDEGKKTAKIEVLTKCQTALEAGQKHLEEKQESIQKELIEIKSDLREQHTDIQQIKNSQEKYYNSIIKGQEDIKGIMYSMKDEVNKVEKDVSYLQGKSSRGAEPAGIGNK